MIPTFCAPFQRLRSLAACVVPCNDPELLWEPGEEPSLWAPLGQQPLGAAAAGKGENLVISCSTELRLKTQFKHCRKAGTAERLCGDEDMKAASVQSFLRPLPARGMLFIGTALRSMPVPARLLPTSPEISQTTRELRKWWGNTNQTKPQALALLLLHH